jgi:hypothetical protein
MLDLDINASLEMPEQVGPITRIFTSVSRHGSLVLFAILNLPGSKNDRLVDNREYAASRLPPLLLLDVCHYL